ncbi:LptF/LptG family permease [Treponema sp.]|uniref:LptF/LptG family permease n=1 Tax=Treponema sp. TaxID=166 RepID=UPI00298EB9FB|nr:LptF/LptG family permease [Treponema sp.]
MLRSFFPIFLGALLFFVLVLCLTDLFMNLWNYISKGVPSKEVGLILLYYVPKTVWYSIPIAMLFATAYMLSDFYARNELLAIFASGISLFRFTVPLLFIAVGMSFVMFFFEDFVVVPTYTKKVHMQDSVLQKEKSLNNDRIVIMSDEGKIIYKADFYDDSVKRLYTVYFIIRDDEKNLRALIYSDNASWSDDKWKLSNPVEYKKSEEGIVMVELENELLDLFVEPPETFRNNTISVEEVNTKQAREYIEHLEKAGLPSAEEKSVYYKKFSFPFVVFIVVFLAIGLSGKTRKNVLIVSLALSITAVVLFYVTQMITMLMAKFQTIPPLFGAWFPVMLFIIISSILLKYAKT